MSESLPFGESLPSFKIMTKEGKNIRATPTDTSLRRFVGKAATEDEGVEIDSSNFDHIFVEDIEAREDNDGEPQDKGWRFFEFEPGFEAIKRLVEQNKYPLLLNQRDVGQATINAYIAATELHAAREFENFPDDPPEWASENNS